MRDKRLGLLDGCVGSVLVMGKLRLSVSTELSVFISDVEL